MKAMAITAKSCSVLYLTVRVKADGGGNEWWFGVKWGGGGGDFKAGFQNGILSLNPHKEITVNTGSQHYFGLLRRTLISGNSTIQTMHIDICTWE